MAMRFTNVVAQRDVLRDRIDAAIAQVLDHGQFILGPEVKQLETQLSEFGEADHTVTCSSGTDALILPLRAWGIGPGDAVFVPSFTFAATAGAPALVGASPVFVDVDPQSFNISIDSLNAAIEEVRNAGILTPKAVIAVDMFGLPADYPAIRAICDDNGLLLLADSAQSFGATLHGRKAVHWADALATSFVPAKPLGCYGDGGAVQTDDPALAECLRSLRAHGGGDHKYNNVRIGMNARLDTIQAAILIEKLAVFPEEIERRNSIAGRYSQRLGNLIATPAVAPEAVSTWAQYTVQVADGARDALAAGMKARGVPTAVYYPRPLHRQEAYQSFPAVPGGLPVSEALPRQVLSLPMHPYMPEHEQDLVVAALVESLEALRSAA